MSIDTVKTYLSGFNLTHAVMEKPQSSATVELAAEAVGVIPARIVKTLSFWVDGQCVLISAAGDAKIDNAKYKHFFGAKAKMLTPAEVLAQTGHAVGGVCPFALPEGVRTYIDISIRRFDSVFPAAGSGNSMIELRPDELFDTAKALAWIDICKDWQRES